MNIKETAEAYEPKSSVLNISELSELSVDLDVLYESEAEFPYSYIEVNGDRYKMPVSVMASLKAILKEKPKMKKFKVLKSGKNMDTRYQILEL